MRELQGEIIIFAKDCGHHDEAGVLGFETSR